MRYNRVFLVMMLGGLLGVSDVFAAAVMQRRLQGQKALQQQAVQAAYQQAVAQKQAQEVAAYQQAMAQRQAMAQQQAAYQKAAMEYAAYKQVMQQAVAKRNAEIQAAQALKQAVGQRQAQQAAYQQAVAQKRMGEVVAYKQAVVQRQVAAQKVQSEVNQQVQQYAQYLAVRKAALAQQSVMVQQAAVGQRVLRDAAVGRVKVEQAGKVAQARVANDAVAKSALGKMLAREVMSSEPQERGGPLLPSGDDGQVSGGDTVVGLKDFWASLDRTSVSWSRIMDKEVKLLTVSEYMDRFRGLKIRISKEPGHYVGLIDAFADQMPGFLDTPFMNVLSYAAIVEYDFESGTNKDDLARNLLGPDQFEVNRKRVFGR
ncbi:MAG: hypothetical protein V2A70_04440 [Candidatus Omnitrophota bacterium]